MVEIDYGGLTDHRLARLPQEGLNLRDIRASEYLSGETQRKWCVLIWGVDPPRPVIVVAQSSPPQLIKACGIRILQQGRPLYQPLGIKGENLPSWCDSLALYVEQSNPGQA